MENVDVDALFKEMWYARSSSMRALRDSDDVEADRNARAAEMQKQQMMSQVPGIADAAQKVSGAVDPSSILAKAVEQ